MQRLQARFGNVVGLDRAAPTPPPPGCSAIAVDIASDQSVRDALGVLREHHGRRIASVVHLAAYYDFLGKPSPKYEQITVEGTRRLLRGLREHFDVEQFLFSSTMLVHKPGEPGEFIHEDWPIEPTWAYPASKVRTEALIAEERGDIATVILRLAGVYDDTCHSPPLAHQMQRIYEGQMAAHLYSGEVSHGQAYLHFPPLTTQEEVQAVAKVDMGIGLLGLARVSHVHLFGISILFLLTGTIFALSRFSARWRLTIMVLPFVAMWADIASWWLTRYEPVFAYVVVAGGVLMGVALAAQIIFSLWELWLAPEPPYPSCAAPRP